MEALILFAVLIPLATIIAAIAGFAMALSLRGRARQIEERLALVEAALVRDRVIAAGASGVLARLDAVERRLAEGQIAALPGSSNDLLTTETPDDAVRPEDAAIAPDVERGPDEALPMSELSAPDEIATDAPVTGAPAAEDEDGRASLPRAAQTAEALPEEGQEAAGPAPASAPRSDIEERLGARWAVWVGGLAVALGGLFLVRYSIEQGWFGPAARVAAGAILAAALIAAGEWLRRREIAIGFARLPSAHIPGVVTAAGTAVAFGTAYAAHALYGFLGPAAAFILLGGIAVATMIAAALHGPALAGLGLVGALAAPLLIGSEEANPWPVLLYLVAVAGAAYALANLRVWLWLMLSTAVGVLGWGLLFAASPFPMAAMIYVIAQTLLALTAAIVIPHRTIDDPAARPEPVATGVGLAFAALGALVLVDAPPAPGWLAFAVAIVVLTGFAGALYPAAAALTAAAGALVVAALAVWTPEVPDALGGGVVLDDLWSLLPRPAGPLAFLIFATAGALGLALLALRRLVIGPTLPVPTAALLSGAMTLTPLAALVVSYLRIAQFAVSPLFAAAALGLAACFTAAVAVLRPREAGSPALRLATGAAASAAVAGLALALSLALDRGLLTVSLALAALGVAWVAAREGLPVLRLAVAGLGLAVMARFAWDPRIVGGDLGTTPILNWLLWGYGVPALAFAAASVQLRRIRDDNIARFAEALAILFAALLVFFEIRHAVSGGDPFAPQTGHIEVGLFAVAAFGFAAALIRLEVQRASPVIEAASYIFGALAALVTVLGLGFAANPAFTDAPIAGRAPFDSLALGYLLPAASAAILAWAVRGLRPRWYRSSAAWIGFGLLFLHVTLEVRHLFQGAAIGAWRRTSELEWWAYSATWLGLGIALLAYGILRASRPARLASAGVIALTAAKVFLLDMSGLEGPLRAISFIGLGLALLAIGWVYQRFLLARTGGDGA